MRRSKARSICPPPRTKTNNPWTHGLKPVHKGRRSKLVSAHTLLATGRPPVTRGLHTHSHEKGNGAWGTFIYGYGLEMD